MLRFVPLALLLAVALPATADEREKVKEKDPARQRVAEKRFEKLTEYLKERRVSHVVELLAEWGEFADANQQDDVLRWVADLRKEEDDTFAKTLGSQPFKRIGNRGVKATPDVDEGEYPSAYFVDEFARVPPPKIWRRNEVVNSQLIVASKTLIVRPNNDHCHNCVVLTNAAEAEFHVPYNCLVISSGNVKVIREMYGSVVVCRGDAEYKFNDPPDAVRVRAGGAVTDTNPIVKGRKKPDGKSVVEKDDKPLGMKFYSCTEDGLVAKAEKAGVTVSKLDAKKPFAKAGVKEGDVIEAINGQKVPSLHELDRLLCRATVASGVAKLTLKRGDKAEEIEVKLADW